MDQCNKYNKDDIVTVYFQGFLASRSQAASYAGPEGLDVYISPDKKEHIYSPKSNKILHNIYATKDLDDTSYESSLNPLHLVLKAKSFVSNTYYDVHGATLSHNYVTEDNVAGADDVKQNIEQIKKCIEEFPDKKIVLFGASRGAATMVTTLANLDENTISHIKLAIVEAPFDTVESVIEASSYIPSLTMGLLRTCTKYKDEQQSPLDAVKNDAFPLDLPIAFVTSKTDNRVPNANTQKLIDVLEGKNHKKLHKLVLEDQHHSTMFRDPRYIDFVEELYNTYLI